MLSLAAFRDRQHFKSADEAEDIRPVHIFRIERRNDELAGGYNARAVEEVHPSSTGADEISWCWIQAYCGDEAIVAKLDVFDLRVSHRFSRVYSGDLHRAELFTADDVQVFDFQACGNSIDDQCV